MKKFHFEVWGSGKNKNDPYTCKSEGVLEAKDREEAEDTVLERHLATHNDPVFVVDVQELEEEKKEKK